MESKLMTLWEVHLALNIETDDVMELARHCKIDKIQVGRMLRFTRLSVNRYIRVTNQKRDNAGRFAKVV